MLPYLPLNKYVLLGIVGLVGVFDSVGFGAFSQLASSFPEVASWDFSHPS